MPAQPAAEAALEPGTRWEDLTDGKLHRLKRGKHFRGDLRAFIRLATEAAAQRGKAVRCLRDEFGKFQYVWITFADAAIPLGAPCPRCDSLRIRRKHEFFGFCPECGLSLIFSGELEAPGSAAAPRRKGFGRHLGHYDDVRIRYHSTVDAGERWVGYGTRDTGEVFLLVVHYALGEDGARIEDPSADGEFVHTVRGFLLEPFAEAVDLDALVPEDAAGESAPPGDA